MCSVSLSIFAYEIVINIILSLSLSYLILQPMHIFFPQTIDKNDDKHLLSFLLLCELIKFSSASNVCETSLIILNA